MLNRINELLRENESFAFETTLSSRSYRNKVLQAQLQGYSVILLFFWLETVELAKERVKTRVREGGHDIPGKVIERRYFRGLKNLFDIYLEIVDGTFIFDNSFGKHELIAQRLEGEELTVLNTSRFNQLKENYDKEG